MLDSAAIRKNYQIIIEAIENNITRAHRKTGDVGLVVVTKTQPVEVIRSVILAGGVMLGENYPEETLPKIAALSDVKTIEWHMIGHLQSRKAHLVASGFNVFEALDSFALAEKLDRVLTESGKVLPVLLEINVSGEESKGGFEGWDESKWGDVAAMYRKILELSSLDVRGLMTMPPLDENPEKIRPYFAKLHRLLDYLNRQIQNRQMTELSMGTSADFGVAIQEGATIVRIGQAIVGPRYYPEKSQTHV
jgi:PLP dependent protein